MRGKGKGIRNIKADILLFPREFLKEVTPAEQGDETYTGSKDQQI